MVAWFQNFLPCGDKILKKGYHTSATYLFFFPYQLVRAKRKLEKLDIRLVIGEVPVRVSQEIDPKPHRLWKFVAEQCYRFIMSGDIYICIYVEIYIHIS